MPSVAYFSMEIGVDPSIPTYSGGLGMLAGDSIRSAADLGLPMVAVTLSSRRGYFRQRLDHGWQREEPMDWPIDQFVKPTGAKIIVNMAGRRVHVTAWRYDVRGCTGAVVPVYMLDTRLPENHPDDQAITDWLYGGDQRYRLRQEAILGIGGVRILRALGLRELNRFHMNEGHAALLVAELLQERMRARDDDSHVTPEDIAAVRKLCVFTTHTPVPAGHDRFSRDLVRELFGPREAFEKSGLFEHDGQLNMTYAALNLSHYVNGVARKHGEVSREMFPQYAIDSITNGVHVATWASPELKALFDRYIPEWRADNFALRHALAIPAASVWEAHQAAKKRLLARVKDLVGVALDPGAYTLGFARRATPYKRADLLLSDLDRLTSISRTVGPLQIIYAGKAHPNDGGGKDLIHKIHDAADALRGRVQLVYLPDYDFDLCRHMVAGCDTWLNTPQPPLEASGTSGMKAAVNGVPHLSILDGWWIEGCVEDVTGWAVDGPPVPALTDRRVTDARSLYDKLETRILPTYYHDREAWLAIMRQSIALNASHFNTQRMMQQYVVNAYFRGEPPKA